MAREALGVLERLNDTVKQAQCLNSLALLLYDDKQPDAAEDAASRAINLISEEGHQHLIYDFHRALGAIYHSKGEREKYIHHFEAVLGIASTFNRNVHLFSAHYSLAEVFSHEGGFDTAHAHVERAKSRAVNDPYNLGRALELQAYIWYKQHRLEEARSGAMRAIEVFEKLGAAQDLENCRGLLQWIKEETDSPVAHG